MKTKNAILVAVLFAASTVTSVKATNNTAPLLVANADALSHFDGMPGEKERTCFYHAPTYDPSLYLEVISCETCLTVKTSSAYNSNTCIQLGTSHESGDIIP